MSEASELKAFKEKLDAKYGKLAKKRLAKISKSVNADQQLIDMSDNEFKNWLDGFVKADYRQAQKKKLTGLVNTIKNGKLDNGDLTNNGQVSGHWVNQQQVIEKLEAIINE